MDVSLAGCSAGNSAQQHTCKRKFFQWAVKWFYANMSEDGKNGDERCRMLRWKFRAGGRRPFFLMDGQAAPRYMTECQPQSQEKPDVPLLATLLQSIGFKLRGFEKSDKTSTADGSRVRSDTMKVIVECGNSGMRACLELEDVKCQCPKPEDANDASFWSVSGTGPTNAATIENANKIEESGSNLLPPVSKDTAKMINDVVHHLFNIIGDKSLVDANHNSRSRSNLNISRIGCDKDSHKETNETSHGNDSMNFVRSHTQPEIVFNISNISTRRRHESLSQSNKKERTSGWSGTMDAECASMDSDQPRPSPPKIASSPVFDLNELCASLDSISVQSEEDTGNLATYLVRAHRSLEKALEIIAARSPANDQVKFAKPSGRGSSLIGDSAKKRTSSICSTGSLKISPSPPISRPGSSCSMPSRGYAALSLPRNPPSSSALKSPISRRSVGATFTKVSASSRVPAAGSASENANKNLQTSVSGASKIPGRRKSFHSLGQLKLAAVNAKNTAVSAHKASTSPTSSNSRGACQSAIPKFSASMNQSATLPTLKVAPLKPSGQKEPKETTRRSLVNPRFGYGTKRT